MLFLLEMSAVPCVLQALMCQSGRRSLTAALLITPAQFFVTLCHIHLSPRKEPHPFIWTNQFSPFGDIAACRRFASPSDETNLCVAICPSRQRGAEALLQPKGGNNFSGQQLIIIVFLSRFWAKESLPAQTSQSSGEWREPRRRRWRHLSLGRGFVRCTSARPLACGEPPKPVMPRVYSHLSFNGHRP